MHAPGASLWADGAYANYGIYVGTMTSYRHVSLFPLLSIMLYFEKKPYYSKKFQHNVRVPMADD
jgi:hypothetical protein